MKGVHIYIEGGGNNGNQQRVLRIGFQAFLSELRDAVRAKRLKWEVTLCGSRQTAYRDYKIALRTNPDWLNILLVDAEAPVTSTPWVHLLARDGWHDPSVGDDCCHLTVQTVEAWLVADPEALEKYYEHGFRRNLLPNNPNVEEIPKLDLSPKLERATIDTKKGKYQKIHHCAALLAKIDVAKVRGRAPHCDRLFTTVIRLIDEI